LVFIVYLLSLVAINYDNEISICNILSKIIGFEALLIMKKYLFVVYLIFFVFALNAQNDTSDSIDNLIVGASKLQKEGDYLQALIKLEKAMAIAVSINNNVSIYLINIQFGNLYMEWDDIQKAKQYYLSALNIAQIINDKRKIAGGYNNVGTAISREKKWDSSLVYYQNARKIYEELNDSSAIAGTTNNIGTIYTYKKDFEKSIVYYKKAYRIMALIGNEANAAVFALNIANSYMSTNQIDSAMSYIRIGNEMAKLQNSIMLDMRVANTFAQLYEKTKDYDKAISFYKEFYVLNDSLFSLEKQNQIIALQQKYEAEKQKTTIELLTKEKEINQIKLLKQSILIYSVVFVIVLVLVILFLVIRQNKLRTKFLEIEKLQLNTDKEKLLADKKLQTSENQILLDRIHHKERELVSSTMHVLQKNELILKLKTELDSINVEMDNKQLHDFSKEMKGLTSQFGVWDSFSFHFEQVHPSFFTQLKSAYPNLTQNDFKLSAYIKIGLNNKEIASIMQIAPDSVKSAKKRLKKKMCLGADDRLQTYLLTIP